MNRRTKETLRRLTSWWSPTRCRSKVGYSSYDFSHACLSPCSRRLTLLVGRNITLTVTITRHGNGSEYPRYADFYPSIEHGMHWARNFFSSDEEYEAFLGENHMFHFSRGSTMLMIKPAKVLEEDRAEREEHAANGRMHMTMSRSFGDRWPIGRDGARYDFEETGDGEQEQHRFELELPM